MNVWSTTGWRMWRTARNGMRTGGWRGFITLGVIGFVWLLIFGIAFAALNYVKGQAEYRDLVPTLVRMLIGLFFYSLFFMTMLSTCIVVWGGLFSATSARFLAQTPMSNRVLYWGASIEGGLWSLWAVITLAVPLLAAVAFGYPAFDPIAFFAASLLTCVLFWRVAPLAARC